MLVLEHWITKEKDWNKLGIILPIQRQVLRFKNLLLLGSKLKRHKNLSEYLIMLHVPMKQKDFMDMLMHFITA
jgi:hypothetical protein